MTRNTENSFDSMDAAFVGVLANIWQRGKEVAPRGQTCKEIIGFSFVLRNPRAREITIRERKWDRALAVGEFSWHVSGSKDVNFISYYVPKWASFSADGCSIAGSCYGHRIFNVPGKGLNQWDTVKELLRRDPFSRRAVLILAEPAGHDLLTAPDIPCITSIQFFLRNNRLDCEVYMRSNDAIWGMCYDVYFATLLQELLACELGVDLGAYTHNCGSLHVYERHYAMAEKILVKYGDDSVWESNSMVPMDRPDQLPLFLKCEMKLRNGINLNSEMDELSKFWRELLIPLIELFYRRQANGKSRALS